MTASQAVIPDAGHRMAPAAYGLLGLPLAFVALPVYVHVPNVYAQQYGVPLAALGAVLLLSRSLDAVVDPWLGRWGDRLYRHAWSAVWLAALGLALAVALGFVALFFPPAAVLSAPLLLVWVGCALTLSHLAYSGLGILHQTWAARQGGGARAQSRWVAWREGFALVGVLLASALPALWGWGLTAALLVLMLALGLMSWRRTALQASAAAVQALPVLPSEHAAVSLWHPWKYSGFRRLLAVFMLNGLASAVPATLVLFFVQDRLQAPKALEPLFLGAYFAAGALSFPLWLKVIDRLGLLKTWALGMALSVLAFVSVVGLGAGDTTGFGVVCVFSGMALGADLTVPGALLNQLIERCGERGRTDGAFMGWWNLATKLNLALAAGLSLPLLGWWGYAPGQQDAAAVLALGLAYGLLPCVLKLLAALALYLGLMRAPELCTAPVPHAQDSA
ncbi:MFS transporter [Limnohabitans sp. T6-5]|uniref:MFS transporter n=1 Tax=Limnohabitans sp. T6-5 TaxID=1100724 RepID=UPI000D39AFD7|nr:MFS transporter [Limnohabitans sp. T6-5]PUE05885.1 MFS transporter [Limnohabitans sp. T6-5]